MTHVAASTYIKADVIYMICRPLLLSIFYRSMLRRIVIFWGRESPIPKCNITHERPCINCHDHPVNLLYNFSDALQHWLDSDRPTDLEYPDCAMDTDLEKKSWTFLRMRLKLLLANYATTLEEDLKLLTDDSSSKMSANKKLAVRMRATEKRILEDAAVYVEQYMRQ